MAFPCGAIGLALCVAVTGAVHEPAKPARLSVVAAAPVFYPGDEPAIYVQFSNEGPEGWSGSVPDPDQIRWFRWVMIEVTKDGQLLPQPGRTGNQEPPTVGIRLRPRETWLIRVPLSLVVPVWNDAAQRAGEYRVRVRDWERTVPDEQTASFRIEPKAAVIADPADVAAALALPNWEQRLPKLRTRAEPGELLRLALDAARPPLVRERAVEAYFQEKPPEMNRRLIEALPQADAVTAGAVVERSERLAPEPLFSAAAVLIQAIRSRDLPVRQAAASALLRLGTLSSDEFDTIVQAREDEADVVVRRDLLRLLKMCKLHDEGVAAPSTRP